jgi:hypothetical protein
VPGGLVRGVRAPAAHLQPSCRYPLHTHCDTHRSPGDARTGPDQGAQSARAPAPPGGRVRSRAGPGHGLTRVHHCSPAARGATA